MTDWPHGDGEMARRIREHDWASTPLGPIAQWPPGRRTAVDMVLGSGHAMQLAWGPEKILLYNDAYAPMLGERHPRALGAAFRDAWPDVWSQIEPLVDRVFAGETVKFDDMPLVMTRHGLPEDTWWNFSYSPVHDEAGAVEALLNVTIDATPRHHLRESQARQAFLLKFTDALRSLVDPARIKSEATTLLGEHLGANRAFYADADHGRWIVTRGYERDIEPMPDGPFEMSDYGDWIIDGFRAGRAVVVDDMNTDPRFHEAERQAHLALQIQAEVALPLVKNGQLVSMLVLHMTTPRAWARAELTLLEDAVERTWAAVERALAEAALRKADRHKDEFLAVLGHELRNGLAPLAYNVEIANRRLGDAALLEQLNTHNARQLQHVVHLVDDLLDVARINNGKIELKLELVKVRDVVNLALDACRPDVDRKGHRLTVIDEAGADLAVLGDRVRLTQVISNLLSNAAKYTDAGGTITVRLAREGDHALVAVGDTGIGIPPAALPQVFDLFTQVRNQQAYSAGGLGIGLSLVRQLVQMQGGSVSAASEGSGRGSTFVVRLPAASADGGQGAAAATQADAAARPRALRVLVVDDHRDAADALAQLLQLEGHDIDVAYGGEQALACARGHRPDLVLLDLGMPGMDGYEVARRLRAEFADGPAMRIVAVTGWGQESDRARTKAASFDGHLTKPPSHAELQAVLEDAARGIA